jgi:hypothetical protein
MRFMVQNSFLPGDCLVALVDLMSQVLCCTLKRQVRFLVLLLRLEHLLLKLVDPDIGLLFFHVFLLNHFQNLLVVQVQVAPLKLLVL